MTEYISIGIAALGFVASVYYSNKATVDKNVADKIDRAKESAILSSKLDGIASDARDTVKAIEKMREEMVSYGNRITKVEESTKSAHHRIDEIIKLHNRCCGAEQHYIERNESNG